MGSPLRAGAGAGAAEVSAVALSRDHNCDDADEAAFVRARSADDNAIRVSRNDEWKGARAIKRVAGSLAVTRAIGDAYLKKAAFSFSPYKVSVGTSVGIFSLPLRLVAGYCSIDCFSSLRTKSLRAGSSYVVRRPLLLLFDCLFGLQSFTA